MKYKNLFLIFIILILSGCSAEYNLEIDVKKIQERLTINNVDIQKFNDLNLPIDYEIDEIEIFEKRIDNIDYYNIDTNENTASIYYDFNHTNYDNSMLFKSCYENTTYTKDEYELLINTSNEFLCYEEYEELENLTVKITSKYKLINTNADKIEKDNYYWYINKENKTNKPIKLRLNTTTVNKSLWDKLLELKLVTPIIIVGITLVIAILLFTLKKIGDRRNKI